MDFPIETLISSVANRPELWDTSNELHKDRYKNKEGWIQVCSEVFDGFEEMPRDEQLVIEKAVITKWRTVRDGYVKGIKKRQEALRSGKAIKRSRAYIYGEQLHFLDKVIQIRETEPTLNVLKIEPWDSSQIGDNSSEVEREEIPYDQQILPWENRALKRQADQRSIYDNEAKPEQYLASASALTSRQDASEEDDNLSFFKSLLPTVRKLSDSQLLEFRIQTMQTLQRMLYNPSQS